MSPTLALEEKKTIQTIGDATVDLYYPSSNFGGDRTLEVGYFISWLESYIKFDLSTVPSNVHKAELRLDFFYIQATTTINIYETSTYWDEYTITWSNAPALGGLVASTNVAEETTYVILITDDIQMVAGEYWAICLTTSNSNWIILASKEGYSWNSPPEIVIYYETSDLPIFIGGIVATVIILGALVVIGNNYYKKRRSPTQPQYQQDAPYIQQRPQPERPAVRKLDDSIKYCIKCGKANGKKSIFCIDCGNKFP